jgi:quinol-cytochrome oxidoreductase complex cytochrome b subunit
MDLTTVLVGINTMNNITSAALITLQVSFFMTMLFMLAVLAFVIWLAVQIGKKPNKSENQTQQPQVQQTQQNTDGTFVDYKTLKDIKASTSYSIALAVLIFIIGFIAFASTANNIGYAVTLAIIMGIALAIIPILYSDSYKQVNKLLPKRIKKIVKVTTIYEDGTTEERERKYEY